MGFIPTILMQTENETFYQAFGIFSWPELAIVGAAFFSVYGWVVLRIIVKKQIMPVAQKGKIIRFKRRKPKQSLLSKKIKSLNELYNHIRMLDAKTYPTAFIKHGNLRIEFKKAKIFGKSIKANVCIKIN